MSRAKFDDFHFSRTFRGDQLITSLSRHKHYLFSQLRLKSGMVVLDVGCGVGSAAIELASFANVRVLGVDTDPLKVAEATKQARQKDLSHRVSFIHVPHLVSLHDHFAAGSFDGVYSIEALRGISALAPLYTSLSHLLRPGGKLAIYEWCWTQAFNPSNFNHLRLAELVELRTGMGSRSAVERTGTAVVAALQAANFRDVHYDDLAGNTTGATLPWYNIMDIALSKSGTRWADGLGESGALGGLTRDAAIVISQAGHLRLFTPMAMLVATRM